MKPGNHRRVKAGARPALLLILILLAASAALLGACGPEETPEPPTPTRPLRPTFTPTSAEVAQAEAPTATAEAAPAEVATPEPPTPAPTDLPDAPAPEPTATPEPTLAPTDTPVPSPRFTVSNATANLRRGPGTNYDVAAQVNQGDFFDVLGKNQDGSWLEIDVAGQALWIAASLGSLENGELVQIAANIPPAPTRAPAPTQPPAAPAEPAPPPASDPCAGIGGDGCKWKLRGGPAFAANNFGLKLTLGFIHSGRGNEAQGSYFIWLEKEGIGKLPVPDSTRSWPGDRRTGPNGAYNYEHTVPLDALGGAVGGCYFGWVLDGNGERDSQNFRFCVPDGQGEVWIEFDQA